jgi:signal transduction histidine kinase
VRLKFPSTLTVLTSVLVVLLPALALLQYRWVGQVSDAERARMQRTLSIAAAQFREAFDDEIGRALATLRMDATTVRESAWYRYADRYANWSEGAEHPGIVANVFLVDAGEGGVRLRRWNPAAETFEEAGWPAPLGQWRGAFEDAWRTFEPGRMPARGAFPPDEALLVTPLVSVGRRTPSADVPSADVFGFTVVQLDLGYIREQFLPALADRHFTQDHGDRYRVVIARYRAVIARTGSSSDVLYRSDPGVNISAEDADEVVPLYSLMRGRGRDRTGRDDRGGPFERAPGQWALLVQHEGGSLDAAVGAVRRRNLAISFGILSLLAGSIALLAASSRRAHNLAQQQMEFVAGVSHELRTPVSVIRSAAENLAQGVVGTEDHVKRYGEMIGAEARRLGETVERVLLYAGIDSGRAFRSRVPLAPAALVEAAIAAASPAGEPLNIQRSIAPDLPAIVGDETALQSALQNLIVNAVKYGGADGWIGVRVSQAVHGRRQEVHVTIEDRGRGIPGEELPHIFEPFYRGRDAVARQIHGSGLGLALVRQIVAAHGGRISVATRAGGGSSFTIALPAADPETHATLSAADGASAEPGAAHS